MTFLLNPDFTDDTRGSINLDLWQQWVQQPQLSLFNPDHVLSLLDAVKKAALGNPPSLPIGFYNDLAIFVIPLDHKEAADRIFENALKLYSNSNYRNITHKLLQAGHRQIEKDAIDGTVRYIGNECAFLYVRMEAPYETVEKSDPWLARIICHELGHLYEGNEAVVEAIAAIAQLKTFPQSASEIRKQMFQWASILNDAYLQESSKRTYLPYEHMPQALSFALNLLEWRPADVYAEDARRHAASPVNFFRQKASEIRPIDTLKPGDDVRLFRGEILQYLTNESNHALARHIRNTNRYPAITIQSAPELLRSLPPEAPYRDILLQDPQNLGHAVRVRQMRITDRLAYPS